MTTPRDIKKLIKKIDKLYTRSSGGKWCVWDGQTYISGGADLCIGTSNNWIANMDEKQCVNYGKHLQQMYDNSQNPKEEQPCAEEEWTTVCEFGPVENITKEQRRTAEMIVELHNNWPEIREMLRSLL